MPAKYVIHATPAAPRLRPVGKLGIVDWREDCSSCHNCVKRACVYGFYRDEADTLRNEIGYLDYIYQCKGCLNCVQNCTKNILTRVVNPEYRRLGDAYYTPDIVLSTWFQAETGRIPVSGSGYGGPFCGPGFDSMWTDMSEIVRPTRDGIHGREYISTSVDIGRKLPYLALAHGQLTSSPPPLVETPFPVVFDLIAEHWNRGSVVAAVVAAAAEIGTLAILREQDIRSDIVRSPGRVAPLLESSSATAARDGKGDSPHLCEAPSGPFRQMGTVPFSPLVMIPDGRDALATQASLKKERADRVVAIRVQASPTVARRVLELARNGAEVVHLMFDSHGRENEGSGIRDKGLGIRGRGLRADRQTAEVLPQSPNPNPQSLIPNPSFHRHARDVLRDVHGTLVKVGIRDEITLIASGGIALAEHVAKAIICGADLVAIDVPLMLALECRLCGECQRGQPCPIALEEMDAQYGTHRIVNLMAAWHQQLIEVLGAMGIREIRRLRGETGRAMFFEDLERETFGRLFGKRRG
jgi:Pyruvate/2-oxoacid:ferredoxin oxidoreductase delta subunit